MTASPSPPMMSSFTWEYAADPATGAVTSGSYQNIKQIDKLDEHTIKAGAFVEPTLFWYDAFVASVVKSCPNIWWASTKGKFPQFPYNLKPVGTGPYKMVEFKPGDVALYEINPHYHVPNRPFFDMVELKGGGDAASAARAVIQTASSTTLEPAGGEGCPGAHRTARDARKVVIFPQANLGAHPAQSHHPWDRGGWRA